VSYPGEAEFNCPQGQVTLQPGDMVQMEGGPAVVVSVDPGGAKVLKLAGVKRTLVNKWDGTVTEFESRPAPERTSRYRDPDMVLRRLTDDEFRDFLAKRMPQAHGKAAK
jgi:ABC-type Fe3+-hydroxamate transport system substrate-binding protein